MDVERWTFETQAARDAFLDCAYPDRQATQVPGVYRLSTGSLVVKEHEVIFFQREDSQTYFQRHVREALQFLEELGGPTTFEYIALMQWLQKEARSRLETAAEAHNQSYFKRIAYEDFQTAVQESLTYELVPDDSSVIELLDTGSVTMQVGNRTFILSLTVEEEIKK